MQYYPVRYRFVSHQLQVILIKYSFTEVASSSISSNVIIATVILIAVALLSATIATAIIIERST